MKIDAICELPLKLRACKDKQNLKGFKVLLLLHYYTTLVTSPLLILETLNSVQRLSLKPKPSPGS